VHEVLHDLVEGGRDERQGRGFVFASRFTGDSCVAIFEAAFGRLPDLFG